MRKETQDAACSSQMQLLQGSPRHSLQSVPCEETKSTSFGTKNQAGFRERSPTRESPAPEVRIGHIHPVIRILPRSLTSTSFSTSNRVHPADQEHVCLRNTLENNSKADKTSHQNRQTERPSHKISTSTKSHEYASQQQVQQQTEPPQHS